MKASDLKKLIKEITEETLNELDSAGNTASYKVNKGGTMRTQTCNEPTKSQQRNPDVVDEASYKAPTDDAARTVNNSEPQTTQHQDPKKIDEEIINMLKEFYTSIKEQDKDPLDAITGGAKSSSEDLKKAADQNKNWKKSLANDPDVGDRDVPPGWLQK